jgi:ABC-2 type transport system ATP-binding protein
MTQELSIQAERLRVEKDRKLILHDLDFNTQSGSITGLIGPSGSGKTTLMRTLVGVQVVTAGKVTILGLPAGSKQLRHKIGYVTQDAAVYTDLTVLQNMHYFAALTSATRSQIDEIIDRVRLTSQRQQLVLSLSGGQRARVSLAIALLGNPRLLIMDEPTIGLDPLLREELWQLFAELAAEGRTLLISSHVMEEAEKCHSLLLLREGKLLWHDSRQKLLEHTRTRSVQEAFLNIIRAKEKTR